MPRPPLELHQPAADLFIPDGMPAAGALGRITHLGIGAHQDDLEFMAFHGILQCHGSGSDWFGGVTCTDGAGSPRGGPYAALSDSEMRDIRRREQHQAARIGRYAAMLQLDYPSREIRASGSARLADDLACILAAARPHTLYLHNPADKHPTHVAVAAATIDAVRRLPLGIRPRHLWGCEVWRDLDWLPDTRKVLMDVTGGDDLADALAAAFDSQIQGGKRYDLAVAGRRTAHATFFQSHATDSARKLIFGMDLSALAEDDGLDLEGFVCQLIGQFQTEVAASIAGLRTH